MRLHATHAGTGPALSSTTTPDTNTERRGWLKRLGAVLGLGLLTGKVVAAPRDVRQITGGDPFVGEIMLFAGGFTVNNYLPCDGRLLNISQNAALFSILGIAYGGNGQTTFALPDLRNRVPRGANSSGNSFPVGVVSGQETVTLTTGQLPPHTHNLNVSSAAATTNTPSGNYPAAASGVNPDTGDNITVRTYGTSPNAIANTGAISPVGSGMAVSVLDPFLGMSYQICVAGIYPSRL